MVGRYNNDGMPQWFLRRVVRCTFHHRSPFCFAHPVEWKEVRGNQIQAARHFVHSVCLIRRFYHNDSSDDVCKRNFPTLTISDAASLNQGRYFCRLGRPCSCLLSSQVSALPQIIPENGKRKISGYFKVGTIHFCVMFGSTPRHVKVKP